MIWSTKPWIAHKELEKDQFTHSLTLKRPVVWAKLHLVGGGICGGERQSRVHPPGGSIQHEQMVLSYIRQHGQIKRAEVMALCRLTEGQVKGLVQRMLKANQIVMCGQGKATTYIEKE